MKLIPLEEALNIMGTISNASQSLDKMRELRNIPTIDLSVIDEMIEEEQTKERDTDFAKWIHETRITLLKELKSRLSTNL